MSTLALPSRVQILWSLLAASAALAWLGTVRVLDGFSAGASAWATPPVLGLALAALIAGLALIGGSHRRWPAAIVLLCAAPMLQPMLGAGSLGLARMGGALPLLVVGAIGTAVTALVILLTKPSPPPRDPIARAVAQLRSSE